MTAQPTATTHDHDHDPTTPGGAALAAPCLDCGTTGGACYGNPKPMRRRGLCAICYERHRYRGTLARFPHACRGAAGLPFRPVPLDQIVTPSMLGIALDEIATRLRAAEHEQRVAEAAARRDGLTWWVRHPEQFTPEYLHSIFGDDLSRSYWATAETAKAA